MIYKELLLSKIDPKLADSSARLRVYISEENQEVSFRPGMLVCPGGAYSFTSPCEAEIVAFRFLSEGFNCFVLDYSVKKKYPAPHLDLMVAISYIRDHEEEFRLLPDSLSLVGFSAGGHLISSYSYLYKELAKEYSFDEKLVRPFSIVLGYPVTLTNEYSEKTSLQYISGGDNSLIEKLSVPDHIDSSYPPTFLWGTKDDQVVNQKNFYALDESLTKAKVKHQTNIYESGPHGLSLVNRSCHKKESLSAKLRPIRNWINEASDFVFEVLDNRK